jgi:hypothetical protein
VSPSSTPTNRRPSISSPAARRHSGPVEPIPNDRLRTSMTMSSWSRVMSVKVSPSVCMHRT